MRCLLICGSPDCNSDFIKTQYRDGDFVVCADKGYEFCKNADITPDLIIGDFDSCQIDLPQDVKTIKLNPVKDDTDTLSCIKKALEYGCNEFLILGALGGRIDHTYANLSLLKFLEKKNTPAQIKTDNELIVLISNGEYTACDVLDKTFSVFPFGCEKCDVTYIGNVMYPLDNYTLTADFPLGISNIFKADTCTVKVKNGSALLIINERV